MIRKPFLWYLQYLFWGQLLGSLITIFLIVNTGLSIPVISREKVSAVGTAEAVLIEERQTAGVLHKANASLPEQLLLTELSWTPTGRDLAGALASLLFSIAMLRFFHRIKNGKRFSVALVQHLKIGGWIVMGYAVADIGLRAWRWKVVEEMTQKEYLPLFRLAESPRTVFIIGLMLFVFAALLNYSHKLQEENDLTV
ncbi:MAG TPA: DUF2975 domain-containing protein [Lacibacter sp.]|nr:DUF2975 domain-containing protein [Lacibacter sp.]HMO87924.1 DUF2975 domain-containing protein [Lacibacter sp.]HMP87274.1 DUF2975 domain-containing protein [Lacibacter sp.]